jgi:hypothetical protein
MSRKSVLVMPRDQNPYQELLYKDVFGAGEFTTPTAELIRRPFARTQNTYHSGVYYGGFKR